MMATTLTVRLNDNDKDLIDFLEKMSVENRTSKSAIVRQALSNMMKTNNTTNLSPPKPKTTPKPLKEVAPKPQKQEETSNINADKAKSILLGGFKGI